MWREFVHRYRFASRGDARRTITGWINRYNSVRQHSSINGLTPIEWESQFTRRQILAAWKSVRNLGGRSIFAVSQLDLPVNQSSKRRALPKLRII
jgi:hypothetical protein